MTPADRIRQFLAMLDAKPLRGADPDVIYAIHTGTEFEAEIRRSDLRALLGDAPAPKRERPKAVEMSNGPLSPSMGLNRAVIEAMGPEAVANYG